MKKNIVKLCLFLFTAVLASGAYADPLEKLALELAKKMKDQSNKKVAVLSFPYHDGTVTAGASIVQERFTTYMAASGTVEVIERNLLNKILQEKKLEMTGIIDASTTMELGKVLGVGAVVMGTLNDVKKTKTEVNARIVQTQTGKILAAGSARIKKTWSGSPGSVPGPGQVKPPVKPGDFLGKPLVQIAILLDTSGSMDGLINQAKTQLWKIVNELASLEKKGDNPEIQVALYEYGNDGISRDENHLRQILPLTSDLDLVSEKLFALTTNGGQEYCGAVIMDSVVNLTWDRHLDVYKAVFIAGNEPFTQGPVDFRTAVGKAREKDIIVNTIFCGNVQEGRATQWEAGAQTGGGDYLNIDQQTQVVAIQAPQDKEIQRLGTELNGTFIPYGKEGKSARVKQEAQDQNAIEYEATGAATQRALFKAKSQYLGASWDLTNAVQNGQVKLEEIEKKDLPSELQEMDKEELGKYIEEKNVQRRKIQDRINRLNSERNAYIDKKRKEMAGSSGDSTLDQAILNAVRSQAAKKEFNTGK